MDFNPRIPCGMRPGNTVVYRQNLTDFNPRIPCGMRHLLGLIVANF